MTIPALIDQLSKLGIREHYYSEDAWYSCPRHPEGCANDDMGDSCSCGAYTHNAEVQSITSLLKKSVDLQIGEVQMDTETTPQFVPSCIPIPDEQGVIRAYLIPVTPRQQPYPGSLILVGRQYYLVAHPFYV